jgi:hypothetical protein
VKTAVSPHELQGRRARNFRVTLFDVYRVEELDDRALRSGIHSQHLQHVFNLIGLAAHCEKARAVSPVNDAVLSLFLVARHVGFDEVELVGAGEVPEQFPKPAEGFAPSSDLLNLARGLVSRSDTPSSSSIGPREPFCLSPAFIRPRTGRREVHPRYLRRFPNQACQSRCMLRAFLRLVQDVFRNFACSRQYQVFGGGVGACRGCWPPQAVPAARLPFGFLSQSPPTRFATDSLGTLPEKRACCLTTTGPNPAVRDTNVDQRQWGGIQPGCCWRA